MLDFGLVYVAESPIFEQNGQYFYPSSERQPGTQFPVGLDTSKHFRRFKGLGSLDRDDVYNAFYDPSKRRLFQVTTDGIDFAMKLVEDIDTRKELLYDK
jgi:DNA gyrase/topoisomerase IV subunit B